MHWSIIEEKEWYTVEHIAHTYSEEENQQRKIDRNNAKLPFNIKYLNIQLHWLDVMSLNDALVYAFIEFFLWTHDKFYVSDASLAKTLRMSESTVWRAIKRLSDMKLIGKRVVRKWSKTVRYVTLWSGSSNWRSMGSQIDGQYNINSITNNNISILDSKNPDISLLFSRLNNTYWLAKDYIEEAFQKKKSLATIEQVCKYIKSLCEEIHISPIYDKRTVNCFHIISKSYTVFELIEKLEEYDYMSDWHLAHYIETLHDIVEADYYLPCVLELISE